MIVVKLTVPGLVTEFTVTVTGPAPPGVPLGTTATICVLLQLVTDVACTPLKLTVLVPCEVPKFDPVIVTLAPIGPKSGETPVTKGLVPTLTDTLSNVADIAEPFLVATTNPT